MSDVRVGRDAAVPAVALTPAVPQVSDATPFALVIMAKRPQAGEVKTRLCPPLTPEHAVQLAYCFLLDKLDQGRRFPGVARVVAYAPPDAEEFFRTHAGEAFSFLSQQGADLGERLADVSDRLLSAGCGGVMIIGTDSPTLPDAVLHEAHAVLAQDRADVVLGPVDDGGYYLIGLRRPSRVLFQEIAWSTDTVLSETVARAGMAGLRTHLLPAWYDVDVESDLRRLVRELANDRSSAPRTWACLRSLTSFAGRDRRRG